MIKIKVTQEEFDMLRDKRFKEYEKIKDPAKKKCDIICYNARKEYYNLVDPLWDSFTELFKNYDIVGVK